MTLLLRRPYQDLATIIEGAIPDLLSALKDVDQVVRMAAASLMGEFSKQCEISLLVILLVLI
jgi:HEAT repeat protein